MIVISGHRLYILRHVFSISCFSVTLGMSIFWCYKFWQDEDLCLVDYKTFVNSHEIDHPMISLCFTEPFIESKLRDYNETFTGKKFADFLKGDQHYHGMDKINFDNVTIKASDFHLGDSITWRNGTYQEGRYPNQVNTLPHTTFIGFWYDHFKKCFGLRLQDKTMRQGYFGFNTSVFPNDVRPTFHGNGTMKPTISFHLPNQILLSGNTLKYTWPRRIKKAEHSMEFVFTHLEVLRRRNKRTYPCVTNYTNYDEIILNKHIERVGCRAPYQHPNTMFPICTTKEKLKEAILNLNYTAYEMWNLKPPCASIGDFRYNFDELDVDWWGTDWFWISMTVPTRVKEIYQVRAVDVQTVIGNAGGYVGLFLGNDTLNHLM